MAIVLLSLGFIFRKDINKTVFANSKAEVSKSKKEKNNQKEESVASTEIEIVQKWNLPAILREVSGIAYIDEHRFACVQDEAGTIFIFNKTTNSIERQIDFAGPGDYEGLALYGNTAYVVRADGNLYEINLKSEKSSAKEYFH